MEKINPHVIQDNIAYIVSSYPFHGEVYSIHYVITLVSALQKVGGFAPRINLTATI
jgi:hypothetical protein